MKPILWQVAGFGIPTHDFFVGLGVTAAVAIFIWEARRRSRLNEKLVWVVFGALITGGLFARLSTGWKYWSGTEDPTLPGLWMQGGRSVLGGLAGAYLGVLITKRLVGYQSSTGDLFVPGLALGMAIGRIGCFLTEQIGTPTSLPWGITLAPDVAAQMPYCPSCALGVPLHPSFIYEILFHAVAFVVVLAWRGRVQPEGSLFKFYLLSYGIFRFLIEFVRGNPPMAGPFSGSQLFLLVTLPLLAWWMLRSRHSLTVAPA